MACRKHLRPAEADLPTTARRSRHVALRSRVHVALRSRVHVALPARRSRVHVALRSRHVALEHVVTIVAGDEVAPVEQRGPAGATATDETAALTVGFALRRPDTWTEM